MVDLGVDSTLNVYIDNSGNLSYVEGKEAFEQRVALRLTDRYFKIVGNRDEAEVIKRLEVEADRVANTDPNIDSMPAFDVSFSDEEHKKIEVIIVYDTGDTTEFTI